MPSFCIVSSCEHRYAQSTNISFHKFPFQKPHLLEAWIQFTDRGPYWKPSRWSAICSRHFLPSDFRDHVSRKCLKRNAIPSVTIKSVDYNLIELNMNDGGLAKSNGAMDNKNIPLFNVRPRHIEPEQIVEIICRLCAKTDLDIGAKCRNIDDDSITDTLAKCFPTIQLDYDEILPKKICVDCFTMLSHFSVFVDRVVTAQTDIQQKLRYNIQNADKLTPSTHNMTATITNNKPVIIKQEVIANGEQEPIECNRIGFKDFGSPSLVQKLLPETSSQPSQLGMSYEIRPSRHNGINTNNKSVIMKQELIGNVKQEVNEFNRMGYNEYGSSSIVQPILDFIPTNGHAHETMTIPPPSGLSYLDEIASSRRNAIITNNKPVIIKQELITNVKQEIIDSNRMGFNEYGSSKISIPSQVKLRSVDELGSNRRNAVSANNKPVIIKQELITNIKQEIIDSNRMGFNEYGSSSIAQSIREFNMRNDLCNGAIAIPTQSGLSYVDDISRRGVIITNNKPVIIKQEVIDSNQMAYSEFGPTSSVQQIENSNPENDAFCVSCDANFLNNFELKNHIVKYHSGNTRQVQNNCEIVDIITLANDSFIYLDVKSHDYKLLEYENENNVEQYDQGNYDNDYTVLEQMVKVENVSDYEDQVQKNIIFKDHNYARSETDVSEEFKFTNSLGQAPIHIQSIQTTNAYVEDKTLYSLPEHLTSMHTPKRKICPICWKDCKNIYHYLHHKRKQHVNITRNKVAVRKILKKYMYQRFICNQCSSVFPTKLSLNNHKLYICAKKMFKLRKTAACRPKEDDFQQIVNAYEQTLDKDEDRIKLTTRKGDIKVLEEVVLKINSQRSYMVLEHPYNSVDGLKSEKKKPLCEDPSDSVTVAQHTNGRYACDLCNRTYGRKSNLYRHRSFHRPPNEWNKKCTACGQLFDKDYDLRVHLREQQCPKIVERIKNDARRLPIILENISIGNCTTVDNVIENLGHNNISNNLMAAESIEPTLPTINGKPKKEYICSQCGVHLESYQKYRNHEHIHTGVKPYVCERCGKRFRFHNNLHQHSITHRTERKYSCTLCTKVFKRLAGLNQHIRGFHYQLKPHVCPVCKYCYALKGDMTRCKHSILKANE